MPRKYAEKARDHYVLRERREAHYFTLREGLSVLRGFPGMRPETRHMVDKLLRDTAEETAE